MLVNPQAWSWSAMLALTLTATPAFATGCNNSDSNNGPQSLLDTAEAAGDFGTLLTAVEAAGLSSTLNGPGPFTVFAPTDAAFAALPAGTLESLLATPAELAKILTFHVVADNLTATEVVSSVSLPTVQGLDLLVQSGAAGVTVNGVKITATDIVASNGVIHVLDAVILPPTKTIVETAVADDRFETLVTAVGAAGLVDTLNGPGPFTVFAPTDDAFAALPAGTLDSLLADPAALANVLTYHVVSGRVYAGNLTDGAKPATVQGDTVEIDLTGGATVNGANIVITNIQCTNGVIHVIDAVLLPPA